MLLKRRTMKLCRRAKDFVQIINEDGAVRLCSWLYDGGIIGYLSKNSLEEIYHSNEAELIRDMHAKGDHSNCNPNQCPWVANRNVEENEIEIEHIPKYPESLYLAYENVCNYKCVMCDIPNCMASADTKVNEEKYNRIDEELIKVLPFVKHISANGLGELFASKHILKLLSEWKPVADKSEVSVTLETNGSLFDKKHWKQIENLGQYHLSVCITILSFKNDIYQELSGTKQHIEKLIENLRFIKTLREHEVINYLELATVYQDKNYKELPEFTRRCIEEFGADYVRLRPYDPWGGEGMKEWMMDVRNIYHPRHEDFLEVMKHPIFSHPKVHDWGGGKESGLGPEPYWKMRTMFSLMNEIFTKETFMARVEDISENKKVVVYGMTVVGKALASRLKNEGKLAYCIDRKMDGMKYLEIPIYGINNLENLDKDVSVIIALHWSENVISSMLEKAGYSGNIIPLRKLTVYEE
ncbi:MAG: SPASM domain-containing protein [Lachnospiraceae bacterium]|nr:SPASM domain-containing protein [Lachnospiraceae bacterium]